ncbi:hypothetical protein OEZ86_008831 [Tetradesmus obliquus]|nr:hypothetical protein OEZ86_008831 [Tetradesmus obliquus]
MIEWREQLTVSGLPVALPRPLGRHTGFQQQVFDPLQNKTLCCWDPGAARALATDNRRPAGTYGPTKRQQSNPLSHAEQPPK